MISIWETAILIAVSMITFIMAYISVSISKRIPMLQYMFLFLTIIMILVNVNIAMHIVQAEIELFSTFSVVYQGFLGILLFLGAYTFIYLFYDNIKELLKIKKR